MTRSFITLVAFIVTTLPVQSPKFVPGEVLTRFVAGSEASAAALRAAETQPNDLSGLFAVVDALGAQVGVPLRPVRVSGGNFCVLSVNAEQLGEGLTRRLGTRRNVRHVQVVGGTSEAETGPSSIRLLLEFTPASDEFKALSGRPDGQPLARLVASLERDAGVPLKGQVVEPSRLALQVDLEALTLRLVERLKTQPILESVQPNYILEGFMRSTSQARGPVLEFAVLAEGALDAGKDSRLTISRLAPAEIVVTGAISTPTPCYAVRPDLAFRGRTLTLRLEASSQPMICTQVLGMFAYQARITQLESGDYTLEVVQTYPGTGWADRIDRLQLQVP